MLIRMLGPDDWPALGALIGGCALPDAPPPNGALRAPMRRRPAAVAPGGLWLALGAWADDAGVGSALAGALAAHARRGGAPAYGSPKPLYTAASRPRWRARRWTRWIRWGYRR